METDYVRVKVVEDFVMILECIPSGRVDEYNTVLAVSEFKHTDDTGEECEFHSSDASQNQYGNQVL